MIEQALVEHLKAQAALAPYLAQYAGQLAVFNQEAPADVDELWGDGPQYGRVVFAVDLQGDAERTMGGTLLVDILCKEDEQFPEEIEPILRNLIHGYFFSNGTFTVAAQWRNSSPFTEPTDHVTGCTVSFDLLGFPVLTTFDPDVVERINEWSRALEQLHVINHDELPSTAWKPTEGESAIYWRVSNEAPAKWIPDTFQTVWRTATIKGHVFSCDNATSSSVAREIILRLYNARRLMKAGEAPIMVNRNNTADYGADPLRAGQITVEATYGVVVQLANERKIHHIEYNERKEKQNGKQE